MGHGHKQLMSPRRKGSHARSSNTWNTCPEGLGDKDRASPAAHAACPPPSPQFEGVTRWSQRPAGWGARLNPACEPARPLPLRRHGLSEAARTFPAASSGRITGSSAPCPARGIQPRVPLVRRVILSLETPAMSGEQGRAACREEEVAVGWQLPSKSGCRSDPCRGAAAPRQVPSLLEWLSHSRPARSPSAPRGARHSHPNPSGQR